MFPLGKQHFLEFFLPAFLGGKLALTIRGRHAVRTPDIHKHYDVILLTHPAPIRIGATLPGGYPILFDSSPWRSRGWVPEYVIIFTSQTT